MKVCICKLRGIHECRRLTYPGPESSVLQVVNAIGNGPASPVKQPLQQGEEAAGGCGSGSDNGNDDYFSEGDEEGSEGGGSEVEGSATFGSPALYSVPVAVLWPVVWEGELSNLW